MSKLNTAQRKALSLDDFGNPGNRLFPIVDQDDVDSAAHLIGKAKNPGAVKARVIAIAKRKGLSLPDAWKSDAKMSGGDDAVPVRFDLKASTRTIEGDYAVYPNSLLWVADDYPDKKYSMSPEENWLAVEHFTPVSGNIEHTDFLGGRACHVRGIRLDADDPARIRAEVAVPLALDNLLEPRERGLSCEWNRANKHLEGLALTTNPRVPVAALMSDSAVAAFAGVSTKHDTYDGQRAIQTIHDMAAKSGALCDATNPNGTQRYSSSYFVSSHERTGLQVVHDAATAHGAKCSAMSTTSTYASTFAALFAGSRHSAADAKDIQAIHDLAAKQGAGCAPARMSTTGRKRVNLKFWQKATPAERAEFRAAGVDVPDEATLSEIEQTVEARMAEERAAFTKQLRDAQAARVATEAASFADDTIRACKAFPAEREAIIAAYTQATLDDATHGPVTFADGKTASRVDSVKAMFAARPAHGLTKETIDPNLAVRIVPATFGTDGKPVEMSALTPTEDGKDIKPERKAYLLKVAGLPVQNGSN